MAIFPALQKLTHMCGLSSEVVGNIFLDFKALFYNCD